MGDESGRSRRQFLAAAGLVGTTALGSSLSRSGLTYTVEIYLSEDLADRAENSREDRGYPARTLQELLEEPFNQVSSNTSIDSFEFRYCTDEYSVHEGTVEEDLNQWEERASSDAETAILLTDKDYRGLKVGKAEVPSEPFQSSVAVLGEGSDFLTIDGPSLPQKVLIQEYNLLENSWRLNHTGYKTALAGEHEIGHTLGLEHGDGGVYQGDDGTILSMMAISEFEQHLRESDIVPSSKIYWNSYFSQSEMEEIDRKI